MTSDILTVDAAARLLHLHPKTVLRFIREERLRATKVGKQYRIARSDLNAFAVGGNTPRKPAARTTSIVDIEDVDTVLHERLSAILVAASKGSQPSESALSINMAHDPALGRLKIILIASPADAAALLKLIDACLEARPS